MKRTIQTKVRQNTVQVMRISMIVLLMAVLTGSLFAQSTVVDIVVGSADHNTLEKAVVAAELADDLSGEGPFTLFAPTDAAFKALPEGTVASLLEDPTGSLADILLYHVVAGSALSTDLSNGQTIKTLNGDPISVKIMDGKAYINDARVTVADIKADNGVVHVIDAVITPAPKMTDASAMNRSQAGSSCGN
jgi:uncharacterized surface protein with fasciclin (FAS1) repeats